MQSVLRTLRVQMAVAAAAAVMASGMASFAHAQAKKNFKDTVEYDLYNEILKSLQAKNAAKMITDLDTWKSKYPESEYKDQRDVFYIQAYGESKQFSKVLATAGPLLAQDLNALYPDPESGPGNVITILYTAVSAVRNLQNPTPEELATGKKAAEQLKILNRKPAKMPDNDWATVRKQLQAAADDVLVYIALLPATVAMQKNDCAAAEAAYTKALTEYPQNAAIAYQLGRAINCFIRANPAKSEELLPRALYAFARAFVTDPTLGGTQDAKVLTEYLPKAYISFHGDSEGLEELKKQATASPLPPAGFTIESSAKASARKEAEFKEKYPQVAKWLGLKGVLSAPDGEAYFTSNMKGTALEKNFLKGLIVEGKPACRSKELLVSVPEPDQKGVAPSVITLKLETPLKGKPKPSEIQFGGAPSAFTKDPFMLTLDIDPAEITGLETETCTAAAPASKKGGTPTKKGTATKKK